MRPYVDASRFNVAPVATRHVPLAWVMLAGASLLFIASLFPLYRELDRLSTAKSAQSTLVKTMQREAAEQRKRLNEQNTAAAQEREKIKAQLQEFAHMSWDGIFDALEVAADTVHAGVSIISLAPAKVNGTATQLNLTALAANVPIMLAYINALQKDPRVSLVELSTQQPDEKVGPAVVRFRLSVVLNPKVQVPHPAREVASAPSSSPSPSSAEPGAMPPVPGAPLGHDKPTVKTK